MSTDNKEVKITFDGFRLSGAKNIKTVSEFVSDNPLVEKINMMGSMSVDAKNIIPGVYVWLKDGTRKEFNGKTPNDFDSLFQQADDFIGSLPKNNQ